MNPVATIFFSFSLRSRSRFALAPPALARPNWFSGAASPPSFMDANADSSTTLAGASPFLIIAAIAAFFSALAFS